MTNPAGERQRLVDDLVNQAFADAAPDPDIAVIAAWMRELPMATDVDLTPEQATAWRELAELATDPHFRQKLRTLTLAATDDPRAEFGLNIRPLVLTHAAPAAARGVPPTSAEAGEILARIVPPDLAPDESASFVTWLALVTDPRIERYWQLLSTLNATDAGPPTIPAYAWLLAAMRAHRLP